MNAIAFYACTPLICIYIIYQCLMRGYYLSLLPMLRGIQLVTLFEIKFQFCFSSNAVIASQACAIIYCQAFSMLSQIYSITNIYWVLRGWEKKNKLYRYIEFVYKYRKLYKYINRVFHVQAILIFIAKRMLFKTIIVRIFYLLFKWV